MTEIAIIGGTGLNSLESIEIINQNVHQTGYGKTSAPLVVGKLAGREVIFLARHGIPHTIPPHKINYRANICALKDCGVLKILSINAVGGISADMDPGTIVIPDQIIDYTYCRENTFYDESPDHVTHIDFTFPYSDLLRKIISNAAEINTLKVINGGTYAATQGPRLESAAEIQRLKQDGCNIVGMTGMPEAALARELNIDYASICLVVNLAAGISDDLITMKLIQKNMAIGMQTINKLIMECIKII